jgi:hypothetical protein
VNAWVAALVVIVLLLLAFASTAGTVIGFVQVRRMNRDQRDKSKKAQ